PFSAEKGQEPAPHLMRGDEALCKNWHLLPVLGQVQVFRIVKLLLRHSTSLTLLDYEVIILPPLTKSVKPL
ncbi:MAG: hypothetical protein Q8O43_06340, partial [Dehalococcoidia bacterium]|nr:hypothetical protein [Dehalococcoidia bacterium]